MKHSSSQIINEVNTGYLFEWRDAFQAANIT